MKCIFASNLGLGLHGRIQKYIIFVKIERQDNGYRVNLESLFCLLIMQIFTQLNTINQIYCEKTLFYAFQYLKSNKTV